MTHRIQFNMSVAQALVQGQAIPILFYIVLY